jgi:diaminopimelate decarboxylase
VGSLCENNDKFAIQRPLPRLREGDLLLIHDTGAHSLAMGFNYNGRLRPQELLLRSDGSVELIRRAEEVQRDYFATLRFDPTSGARRAGCPPNRPRPPGPSRTQRERGGGSRRPRRPRGGRTSGRRRG